MRDIHIDLSDDKCSPVVFGGYVGEHNETKVIIKLPNRLLTNDITKYQFVFKNSKNEIHTVDVIDLSDIANGNLSTMLTEDQTIGDCLVLSVTAIVERGGLIARRAKTPIVFFKVRDSIWDM